MSRRKTERLLNLVICLLATRRPLSAEQIRQAVPGYDAGRTTRPSSGCSSGTRTSCARSASRSRSHKDPWEDEPGYRIVRQAYELPEITLEPDEAAVLGPGRPGVAAGQPGRGRRRGAAQAARRRGGDRRGRRLLGGTGAAGRHPRPGLPRAVGGRARPARGPLRLPAAPASESVLHAARWSRGAWSAGAAAGTWSGHDRDRDAPRVFRLSRISGHGRHRRPARGRGGARGRRHAGRWSATATSRVAERTALIRVREGTCQGLRQVARAVRPGADGWDELDARLHRPRAAGRLGRRASPPTPRWSGRRTPARP